MPTNHFVGYRRPNGDYYCFRCANVLPEPRTALPLVTLDTLPINTRCKGPCNRLFDEPAPPALHAVSKDSRKAARQTCDRLHATRASLFGIAAISTKLALADADLDPDLKLLATLLKDMGPHQSLLDSETLYRAGNQVDIIALRMEATFALALTPPTPPPAPSPL